MNCNKFEAIPNINSSDNAVEIYTSSELPCSHHRNCREPIKSSTQELINESKALIDHAEKLMINYKAIYKPKT